MKQAPKYFICLSVLVCAIIFMIGFVSKQHKQYRVYNLEQRVLKNYQHQDWSDSVDAIIK